MLSRMQTLGNFSALLSLLCSVHADVVERFEDVPECVKYFYKEKVPEWGASAPGAARLCHRFSNKYHFATLYDTNHRIAVYAAYKFQPSNGGGQGGKVVCRASGLEGAIWYRNKAPIVTQIDHILVDVSWQAEMKEGYWLGKDHPGVYQGERQALNEDYTHSGFDRGHLNPNGHHAVPSRNATFTLTNVVPQNPKLNQDAWRIHESRLADLFRDTCSEAFVLVGAVPSAGDWIVKNNVRRVNIPEYLWNAYCCVDNNGVPVQSGGATARNTEANRVEQLSLDELGEFLQPFSNSPVGALFYNNCRA